MDEALFVELQEGIEYIVANLYYVLDLVFAPEHLMYSLPASIVLGLFASKKVGQ